MGTGDTAAEIGLHCVRARRPGGFDVSLDIFQSERLGERADESLGIRGIGLPAQHISDGLKGDLAEVERRHYATAESLQQTITPAVEQKEEDAQRRLFVLQIVQPGLAGLMDGSVSTLAPVFAAALATKSSWDAFLVGLAASVGAGISMAFAEALSDDGSLTGRGRPVLRGSVTGLMTAAGGIGHTLPFLISDFRIAMIFAMVVVAVELAAISYIRHRYMDTPLLSAAFQVVLGGALVFLTGILIGRS